MAGLDLATLGAWAPYLVRGHLISDFLTLGGVFFNILGLPFVSLAPK